MRSQKIIHKSFYNKTLSILLIAAFLFAMIPAFGISASEKEVTVVEEQTHLRTLNEKHFLCSDGTIMAVSFQEDVHYQDEGGNYVDIDNTIEYDTLKGKYSSKGNPNFKVSFGNKEDSPECIIEDKEGNELKSITKVDLTSLSTSASREATANISKIKVTNKDKLSVSGMKKDEGKFLDLPTLSSKMEYKNAYGAGISLEYIIDGNTLKENVVFAYPSKYSSIKTSYSMKDLSIIVLEDGSLVLYKNKEAVYYVDAPYMYDANGSICPDIKVTAFENDGVWTVSYVPDISWKNSPERVYPIVFDPAIKSTVNSGTDVDAYSTTTGTSTTITRDGYLKVGVENGSYYRTFIKPISYPTVPEGNVVVGTSLILTKYSVVGNGYLEICKISGNANFNNNNYSISDYLAIVQYGSSSTETTFVFNLPASEFENCGNGYVIKDALETTSGDNSHYVAFHSARASMPPNRPKTTVTYVAAGIDNKTTALLNPSTEKFISAASSSAVFATKDTVDSNLWKFVPSGTGTYQIVSLKYANRCLKASSSGTLSLVASTTEKSALWYVTVENGKYYIFNEQYGVGLYIKESSDTYTCKIDTGLSSTVAQREWKFSNNVPKVATIKLAGVDYYVKNKNGKNYYMESIVLGSYQYDINHDKCGFRLVYDETQDAYRIFSISSCNGKYRGITATGTDTDTDTSETSNKVILREIKSQHDSIQLFEIELLSDGKYTIKLKNGNFSGGDLLLTAVPSSSSETNVHLKVRDASLLNQKWELSNYQYQSPLSTTWYNYSDVDEEYKSMGFSSPFLDTNKEVVVTSDYGIRDLKVQNSDQYKEDDHKGVDLSADHVQLTTPIEGTVAFVNSTLSSSAGRYVVIETADCYEYGSTEDNPGRKIYIIYMHLKSISVQEGDQVDVGSLIGVSGRSGQTEKSHDPHLHYGVFLAEAGLRDEFATFKPWNKTKEYNTAIDPLMFFDPDSSSVNRDP